MSDFSYLKEVPNAKNNIIKGLQLIQNTEGFISDEAIIAVGKYFDAPEVDIEGVVTFYAQFRRTKPGKYKIAVCDGTACHIKGSTLILDWVSTDLGIGNGETSEDGIFSLETVACLGCCSLAPVLSINGKIYGNLERKSALKILKEYKKNG